VCPRCDTVLEPVDSPKSRRRDAVYIILGVIALAVTAFWEMDLGNLDDLVQGGCGVRRPGIWELFLVLHQGQGRDGVPHRVASARYLIAHFCSDNK